MIIKLTTAMATLLFLGNQAAQAEPKFVVQPYVCNVGGNAEAADATWITIPGRGVHTLQLTLEQPENTTYIDFPGCWISNFKGTLHSITFAVGPVKSQTSGIINDARIGPHIVGIAHYPGQPDFIFDLAAKDATINNTPDAFGFRTVTASAAQLGLGPGASVSTLTITVAGAVQGHIPLTEDVDSIVVNGITILVGLDRPLLQCPVTPPPGSGI